MQQGGDAFPEELPDSGADRWAALFAPRANTLEIGLDQVEEENPLPALDVANKTNSNNNNNNNNNDSKTATSGTSAGDSSTGICAGVGVGVGPDELDNTEVGCQADFPEPQIAAALTEEEASRITNFLQILRASPGPATSSTLQTLLKLLGSLPKPHGPRLLLQALRDEQPDLFERLHESMRRTQQRSEAA